MSESLRTADEILDRFLTGFREIILNDYDIVGHIHTKKSVNTGINVELIAQGWRRFLYANLLADKEVMADTIIGRFAADDSIGLVFPDEPHIMGWGQNLPYRSQAREANRNRGTVTESDLQFSSRQYVLGKDRCAEAIARVGLAGMTILRSRSL